MDSKWLGCINHNITVSGSSFSAVSELSVYHYGHVRRDVPCSRNQNTAIDKTDKEDWIGQQKRETAGDFWRGMRKSECGHSDFGGGIRGRQRRKGHFARTLRRTLFGVVRVERASERHSDRNK